MTKLLTAAERGHIRLAWARVGQARDQVSNSATKNEMQRAMDVLDAILRADDVEARKEYVKAMEA